MMYVFAYSHLSSSSSDQAHREKRKHTKNTVRAKNAKLQNWEKQKEALYVMTFDTHQQSLIAIR